MQFWNALTTRVRRASQQKKQQFALNAPIVLPQILFSSHRHYLVCVTVVKDDGPYLDEWLHFHLQMGVEHFYVYDNGSTDYTLAVLLPYQEAGLVTVVPWRHFSLWANTQRQAYAHAISNFGWSCFWMAFFDVDEFMFATGVSTLSQFLRKFEDFPGIAVTGINFGTNDHHLAPIGLVTENYRRSVPMMTQREHEDLLNVKSIVRPNQVFSIESAHWFNFQDDKSAGYNEEGEPLSKYPRRHPPSLKANAIRYNHYYTRSLETFFAKVNGTNVRGEKMTVPAAKRWATFRKIEQLGEQDDAIQKYIPDLKARLSRWHRSPARNLAPV